MIVIEVVVEVHHNMCSRLVLKVYQIIIDHIIIGGSMYQHFRRNERSVLSEIL